MRLIHSLPLCLKDWVILVRALFLLVVNNAIKQKELVATIITLSIHSLCNGIGCQLCNFSTRELNLEGTGVLDGIRIRVAK